MTNTKTTAELRDESTGIDRQGYRLTRTYRVDADVLQIDVRYDSYERQSHAVVKIMGSDRKFEVLLSASPSAWHARCASYVLVGDGRADVRDELSPVADKLLTRALAVLA